MGGVHRLAAFGVDQVGHRLGLAQLHFAVEEGALGELARLGGADTELQDRLEYRLRDQHPAVAGDLGRLLAGIGSGLVKKSDQHLVDRLPLAVYDLSEMDGMARLTGQIRAFKGAVHASDRILSGYAHDGNPPFAHRRGDGGYRLFLGDLPFRRRVPLSIRFIHGRTI